MRKITFIDDDGRYGMQTEGGKFELADGLSLIFNSLLRLIATAEELSDVQAAEEIITIAKMLRDEAIERELT